MSASADANSSYDAVSGKINKLYATYGQNSQPKVSEYLKHLQEFIHAPEKTALQPPSAIPLKNFTSSELFVFISASVAPILEPLILGLSKANEDIAKATERIAELQKVNEELNQRLSNLSTSFSTSPRSPRNPDFVTFRARQSKRPLQAASSTIPPAEKIAARIPKIPSATDFEQIQEKAKNVVVKFMPESVEDRQKIDQALKENELDPSLVTDIKRQGNATTGHRPLKVFTASEDDKVKVFTALVRSRHLLGTSCYIRRDYTLQELRLDARLRRQAKEWNNEVGYNRFRVGDVKFGVLDTDQKQQNQIHLSRSQPLN